MNQINQHIAIVLADTMDDNLKQYLKGRRSFDFVGDLVIQYAILNDSKNIPNPMLSAVWNFADSFFDAASHGFKDLDGISWNEATELMKGVINLLREEKQVTDERILRYT